MLFDTTKIEYMLQLMVECPPPEPAPSTISSLMMAAWGTLTSALLASSAAFLLVRLSATKVYHTPAGVIAGKAMLVLQNDDMAY